MRWRYVDGGLPPPDLQVPVGTRLLDVGRKARRVGGEHDGLEAHMTREQLRSDRARHNLITLQGWTLLHVTDADVYRSPRSMVATAARALGLPEPVRARRLLPAPLRRATVITDPRTPGDGVSRAQVRDHRGLDPR